MFSVIKSILILNERTRICKMAGPSFEVIQFILYLIYIFWETVKMNFIIICLYLNEIFILAESQLFNIFV
jgi:hypothetical protein